MSEQMRAWENAHDAAKKARNAADRAYAEWAGLNAMACRLERAAHHAFTRYAESRGYFKGPDGRALIVRARKAVEK